MWEFFRSLLHPNRANVMVLVDALREEIKSSEHLRLHPVTFAAVDNEIHEINFGQEDINVVAIPSTASFTPDRKKSTRTVKRIIEKIGEDYRWEVRKFDSVQHYRRPLRGELSNIPNWIICGGRKVALIPYALHPPEGQVINIGIFHENGPDAYTAMRALRRSNRRIVELNAPRYANIPLYDGLRNQ